MDVWSCGCIMAEILTGACVCVRVCEGLLWMCVPVASSWRRYKQVRVCACMCEGLLWMCGPVAASWRRS